MVDGVSVPGVAPRGGGERGARAATLVLCGAVVIGALARIGWCAEGLPYLHSWDEPYSAGPALRMLKTGNFNPDFFGYGTLSIYLYFFADLGHYLALLASPGAVPPLAHFSEIQTQYETGWLWTISHPSFYFWDRCVTAAFGTVSILLAGLLARRLAGPWAGAAAAALLAGAGFHVRYSAFATPDVPAAALALAGAYFAVVFLGSGKAGALAASLAACGFAASVKYNAVVSLAAPILALILRGRGGADRRGWLWAALAIVPPVAFLIGTPYALLDLPNFLAGAGGELRHYKVLGHGAESVAPGLPHLALQLRTLAGNLGVTALALAVVGLGRLASRREGWVILIGPLAQAWLMAGTKVNFHRNWTFLYPLAAIAFGAGAVALVRWLRTRDGSPPPRFPYLSRAAAAAVGLLAAFPLAVSSFDAWRAGTRPETRTQAVRRAEALAGSSGTPIAIASELRVHDVDLAGMKAAHVVGPLLDLLCGPGPPKLIVTAARWSALNSRVARAGAVMTDLDESGFEEAGRVGGGAPHSIDLFSADPGIRILRGPAPGGAGAGPCLRVFAPAAIEVAGPHSIPAGGGLLLAGRGTATTPFTAAGGGPMAFLLRASGKFGGGAYPLLKLSVLRRLDETMSAVVVEEVQEMTKLENPFAMRFEAGAGEEVALQIGFVNGFEDPPERGNRAVTLADVRLVRLAPRAGRE